MQTKPALQQTLFEIRSILRNGEQLMVTFLFPIGLFFLLTQTTILMPELTDRVQTFSPGIFTIAIIATSFTSQAIATAFDRRNGVLRLIGTTPVGRSGLLTAKIGANLGIAILQSILLYALISFSDRDANLNLGVLLLAIVLGTITFTALAFLIAGTIRAEAVLALANIFLILMLTTPGVLKAYESSSSLLDTPLKATPQVLLANLIRPDTLGHVNIIYPSFGLLAWAVAFSVIAARTFKWD